MIRNNKITILGLVIVILTLLSSSTSLAFSFFNPETAWFRMEDLTDEKGGKNLIGVGSGSYDFCEGKIGNAIDLAGYNGFLNTSINLTSDFSVNFWVLHNDTTEQLTGYYDTSWTALNDGMN